MKINWDEDWWLVAIPVAAVVGLAISLQRKTSAAPSYSQAIVDLRGEASPNKKAAPHVRMRKNIPYATTLHQMSFSRGNDPRKYLGVTAHYIVLQDGTIAQLYDHNVRLPASNGFNTGSISIEFAGNFPSKSRSTQAKHYWFPKGMHGNPNRMNQLTAAQARAGQFLLRYLKARGFTHVLAHRQSAGDKGNGPGPDIWGAIGEYGVRRLGLSDGGLGYAIGSGNPIKDSWRQAYNVWHGGSAVA